MMSRSSISSVLRLTVLIFSLIIFACTEKTYLTNPTADTKPPFVEWVRIASISDSTTEDRFGNPPHTVRDTVLLVITASDEFGIDSVKIYINGTVRLPRSTAANRYEFLWNTLADSDGVYSLEARAWDKAGNMGVTPSVMLYLRNNPPPSEDSKPPILIWISPAPNTTIRETITISLYAFDDTKVDTMRIYINGEKRFASFPDTIDESIFSFDWNTILDEDGTYTVSAMASDRAGNIGIPDAPLVVRVSNTTPPPPPDRTPPTAEWIKPTGYTIMKGVDTLIISAFDSAGIDSLRFFVNGTKVHPERGEGSLFSFLWNTLSDSDGVYVLEARAWDASRNMGLAPALAVRVQNSDTPPPPDHTPPRISWISPPPGSMVRDTIEVSFLIEDSSSIDSVYLFIDGEIGSIIAGQRDSIYTVMWNSWRQSNGRRIFEVRAFDEAGNIGIGSPVGFDVDNHRLIWVPDDFEKIQDAINASVDGDTVRVREGTYFESPDLNKTNIWFESENGPAVTQINAEGMLWGVFVRGEQDSCTCIRGFTIRGSPNIGINMSWEQASPKIINNIIMDNSISGLRATINNSIIRNNLFIRNERGAELFISYGIFENNMILESNSYAIWNSSTMINPLVLDFNLFNGYENLMDNDGFRMGNNNLIGIDPRIDLNDFTLLNDSPCIDAGNPYIEDIDHSRSDIGVYGGPYGYRAPNQ